MSTVEEGPWTSLYGWEGLLDVGSSSEVHQAGKGGKDVFSREKNIIRMSLIVQLCYMS